MLNFCKAEGKVYPLWTWTAGNSKIAIFELIVMQVYYFQVFEDSQLSYSSIDNNLIFTEFKEAVDYIKKRVQVHMIFLLLLANKST